MPHEHTIAVDCAHDTGPLDHFWQSTGFANPHDLFTPRMAQTMTYVAGVANGGIRYQRIHFLLDLVAVSGMDSGNVVYDWSQLDRGLDLLQERGIKVFFELMGNPSGWFSDFTDIEQLRRWRDLCQSLAEHLMERYGREEVESWYFECWNEPDCGWWPQFIDKNWPALCHYFSACVTGIKAANPRLRIGGPGTTVSCSDAFTAFVAHCDDGENILTGECGLPIDFISTHVKGGNADGDFPDPNTAELFERKRRERAYIVEHHPRLADLPVIDDECDPMVSWKAPMPWRPRPYYPAIMSRILDGHLRLVRDRDGTPFTFLSNDNGFLGGWNQRTQLATVPFSGRPDAEEFELIKKPNLTVMSLWSLLGDRRIATDEPPHELPACGAIASRRGDDQVAILLYHSRDAFMASAPGTVRLRLSNLPFTDATRVCYRIAEDVPYAHQTYLAKLERKRVAPAILARMRAEQEPTLDGEPQALHTDNHTCEITVNMPLPSVALVLLTRQPSTPPASVTGLQTESHRGTTDDQQVMLRWDHVGSRCLRTYEVACAPLGDGDFVTVRRPDSIDACYLHVRPASPGQRYRVRVVDYWGRQGPWSTEAIG